MTNKELALLCLIAGFLGALFAHYIAPVVIKREIHRQNVACAAMQEKGYDVYCDKDMP